VPDLVPEKNFTHSPYLCRHNTTQNPKVISEGGVMSQTAHWLQWGTPHHPKNYPFPWTDPQTQPSASSPDPSNLPSQTASISDQPFCHNAPDKQTEQQEGMFDDYRPLSLYRQLRGLIIYRANACQ